MVGRVPVAAAVAAIDVFGCRPPCSPLREAWRRSHRPVPPAYSGRGVSRLLQHAFWGILGTQCPGPPFIKAHDWGPMPHHAILPAAVKRRSAVVRVDMSNSDTPTVVLRLTAGMNAQYLQLVQQFGIFSRESTSTCLTLCPPVCLHGQRALTASLGYLSNTKHPLHIDHASTARWLATCSTIPLGQPRAVLTPPATFSSTPPPATLCQALNICNLFREPCAAAAESGLP